MMRTLQTESQTAPNSYRPLTYTTHTRISEDSLSPVDSSLQDGPPATGPSWHSPPLGIAQSAGPITLNCRSPVSTGPPVTGLTTSIVTAFTDLS